MIPPVHRSHQTVDTRPYVHRSNLHRSGGNRRHPGNFRSENPNMNRGNQIIFSLIFFFFGNRFTEQQHHVPRPIRHEPRAQNYGEPADYSMIHQ